MSSETLLEKEVIDTHWEHSQHDSYENDCSTCYSEMVRTGCRNMDCVAKVYKQEAEYSCEACQHKAEELDIGI